MSSQTPGIQTLGIIGGTGWLGGSIAKALLAKGVLHKAIWLFPIDPAVIR
ncbi:hypothetical protein SAMN05216222_5485 [Pseudomonas prosekii]|uniref:Uncharacterized protein n=1 Tax=Pseudomonas prosekii TaxID=1148509 RepID=A0A1H2BUY0_9PSED|nr:hypothetical protein SAMN05216222_5485 [Pseudomonas prosekii]